MALQDSCAGAGSYGTHHLHMVLRNVHAHKQDGLHRLGKLHLLQFGHHARQESDLVRWAVQAAGSVHCKLRQLQQVDAAGKVNDEALHDMQAAHRSGPAVREFA